MSRSVDVDTVKSLILDFPEWMTFDKVRAIKILENAPTVEHPLGSWIPVSERLPKMSGLYLVSIDDLVTTLSFDGIGFRNKGGIRVEVSAWMLLPDSYKGGEGYEND